MVRSLLKIVLIASSLAASAAPAQNPAVAKAHLQSAVEALAQDAAEYARQHGVSLAEAMSRLRAQEESVAATDRLADTYRERLAGISIEHGPEFRIVVLLTGDEPVGEQSIQAGGEPVPVIVRTGASATRAQVVEAMRHQQAALRAALPSAAGMGLDQRTGELVMMVKAADADRHGAAELDARFEAIAGVPVRIRILDRQDMNASLEGGARVEGIDPANGRRYACTTGFVVTDGSRTGLVTAAHCPDALTYLSPRGERHELPFSGQWGWRYQDVQLHISEKAQEPLFYADTAKTAVRRLTSWRNRASTRAGDVVCRRGETTGYSCSSVELTDYAPPGDLCGGPCEPSWITVTGPSCKSGDSGGPIFLGTTAFGITKGGNYSRSGACNFYYYMSTDYLPEGWSLLHANSAARHAGWGSIGVTPPKR